MPMNDPKFPPQVAMLIKDGNARNKALSDPNGWLKANGIDVGNAKVQATYSEHNQQGKLDIVVDNAGANWTGIFQLKLRK
jgi:hypothetical protein